jgi:hypothetical protein
MTLVYEKKYHLPDNVVKPAIKKTNQPLLGMVYEIGYVYHIHQKKQN